FRGSIRKPPTIRRKNWLDFVGWSVEKRFRLARSQIAGVAFKWNQPDVAPGLPALAIDRKSAFVGRDRRGSSVALQDAPWFFAAIGGDNVDSVRPAEEQVHSTWHPHRVGGRIAGSHAVHRVCLQIANPQAAAFVAGDDERQPFSVRREPGRFITAGSGN